jgi:thiamine biosynthesis lipoprotein
VNRAPARISFRALGTTAVVITDDPDRAPLAEAAVRARLAAVDVACSRFRPDSELERLNAAAGQPVNVSALLIDAIELSLDAARLTDGVVVPTIGLALKVLGYDRDFSSIEHEGPRVVRVGRVPGWQEVRVDRAASTVRMPSGVCLDLGATAKAWAADLAALDAARASGSPVLVSLGGDIAVAGDAPESGWPVLVTDSHAADPEHEADGEKVLIWSGGLATSSTTVRQWKRNDERHHHIIDPATGASVVSPWRTVSVAASTCADANIASTASIVMGDRAITWLEAHDLPARLVRHDGEVVRVGSWPQEQP